MSRKRRESTYNLVATGFTLGTVVLLLVLGVVLTGNTVIVVGDVAPTPTLIVTPLQATAPIEVAPLNVPTSEAADLAPQAAGAQPESQQTPVAIAIPTDPLTSYAYQQAAELTYEANANSAGCEWLSIAGRVVDAEGRGVEGLPIEVRGERFEAVVFTGTASRFGEAGFEVQVHNQPLRLTFAVQVLNINGTALSAPVEVETAASCEDNVAVVVFERNPDYTAGP